MTDIFERFRQAMEIIDLKRKQLTEALKRIADLEAEADRLLVQIEAKDTIIAEQARRILDLDQKVIQLTPLH